MSTENDNKKNSNLPISDVRQSALNWWNELPQTDIFRLTGKYGFEHRRSRGMLTGREVQHIYECEHSA